MYPALYIYMISNQMVGAIDQAIEGKIKATFYTDKWPDVSAVVCKVHSPRISDVSMYDILYI